MKKFIIFNREYEIGTDNLTISHDLKIKIFLNENDLI